MTDSSPDLRVAQLLHELASDALLAGSTSGTRTLLEPRAPLAHISMHKLGEAMVSMQWHRKRQPACWHLLNFLGVGHFRRVPSASITARRTKDGLRVIGTLPAGRGTVYFVEMTQETGSDEPVVDAQFGGQRLADLSVVADKLAEAARLIEVS